MGAAAGKAVYDGARQTLVAPAAEMGAAAGKAVYNGARRTIAPVVMPIQALGTVGRVASMNALARSLPYLMREAEPAVMREADKFLREMHAGDVDPDELLEPSLRWKYALKVEVLGEEPAVQALRIELSNVARAVPQSVENGEVTRIALEVDADVEVDAAVETAVSVVELREAGVHVQATGRHCVFPNVGVSPRRVHVTGPVRVWWDTRNGVMSAVFLSPPTVAFKGDMRLTCCRLPEAVTDAVVGAALRLVLPELFTEDDPLRVPVEAPVALRIVPTQGAEKDDETLATLAGQVRHSVEVLRRFTSPALGESSFIGAVPALIPEFILKGAVGLAFITHLKLGFGLSATFGSGLIIRRLPGGRGWSAPSSIGGGGIGVGPQTGASKTDTLIILRSEEAIRTFSGRGQLKLGSDLSVAVGPVGRELTADARMNRYATAAGLSYSHSQGLYVGGQLGAEVLLTRRIDNEEYYHRKGITAAQILSGDVPRPVDADARALYELLDSVCASS